MKIKIFFLILLLYVVSFVDCADDEFSKSRTEADSKLIIMTSLILSQLDFIACLYVLGRTYLQWKRNGKNSIPMNLRLPFYITLIESSISILQTINWSFPAVGELWLHPLCSTVSLFSIFLIAFAMNVVTFITIINWYKVKRNVYFNSGRYDYIIFLISAGFSMFYTLLGVNRYGKVQYWYVFFRGKYVFKTNNKYIYYTKRT
ncbi:hypothetical protein C1645_251435 [Glomus cerebriforme]|uniref:G-protein coupled receptors family 1 profile domain-containing protein n=1 Tax=Glomus cerebriforme TaxID=658196 RepID=A0A397STM9_9GLOM|nr:hypothetical protein C1645_251435 [Glomus cerebriforme]